ncbi:hypothetical protein [Nocardia sp. NBC_00511]|uniref:hypothetical protein n=1 Tax=Nocardia sp. NBC_00511 TaxID=2903591 RepID=UPI0030DE12C0
MEENGEIDIRVLREVIDAVEDRLRAMEARGGVVTVTRAEIYATVIYAVMSSAREAGHYGAGSLVRAPLLDEVLAGADPEPWETALYAVLVDRALTM